MKILLGALLGEPLEEAVAHALPPCSLDTMPPPMPHTISELAAGIELLLAQQAAGAGAGSGSGLEAAGSSRAQQQGVASWPAAVAAQQTPAMQGDVQRRPLENALLQLLQLLASADPGICGHASPFPPSTLPQPHAVPSVSLNCGAAPADIAQHPLPGFPLVALRGIPVREPSPSQAGAAAAAAVPPLVAFQQHFQALQCEGE